MKIRAESPDNIGQTIKVADDQQDPGYYWPDLCEVEGCAAVMKYRIRANNTTSYVCETHRGLPRFEVEKSHIDLLRPEVAHG